MKSRAMSGRTPVEKQHLIPRATPAEVYAVVSDFGAYPRLFPEMKGTRLLGGADAAVAGGVARVEFRLQVVLPIRYVLDVTCDPAAHTLDWRFVEGEIVTDSVGGWRLAAEGEGTVMSYRVALEREVRRRQGLET
jgi:ribosome-associated toxin RatA of RatAB toxin-antitoxin module